METRSENGWGLDGHASAACCTRPSAVPHPGRAPCEDRLGIPFGPPAGRGVWWPPPSGRARPSAGIPGAGASPAPPLRGAKRSLALKKPVVVFKAHASAPLHRPPPLAPRLAEWAESVVLVEAGGRAVRLRDPYRMGALAAPRAAEARPRAPLLGGATERREFGGDGGSLYLATSSLFFHPCECGTVLRLCHMIGEFWTFLAYAGLLFRAAWPGAPVDASLRIVNSHATRLGNYGNEAFDESFYARRRCRPYRPCSRPTPIRTIPMAWRFRSPDAMTGEAIADAAWTMARLVCKMYRETFPKCYDRNGRFAWYLYEYLTAATPRGCNQ